MPKVSKLLKVRMAADIIIQNARVTTFDPERPFATALAIEGNKIVAVGSDTKVTALAGPDTRQIDARQGTVLPGFIDSHVHLFVGSVELDCLNLYGVSGIEAMKDVIRPYADAHPEDDMVFCIMADYDILGDGTPLTRHALDEVLPDPNEIRAANGAPGPEYWQQRADYKIAVTLDDEKQRLTGSELITYTNNSPMSLSYLWVQLDQNRRAKDSDTYKISTSSLSEQERDMVA